MHIAINCQQMAFRRTGPGPARYTQDLIHALAEAEGENHYTIFVNNGVERATLPLAERFQLHYSRFPVRRPMQRILWEQFLLPFSLRGRGVDVVHFPDRSVPLLPLDCPCVVTVHDSTFAAHANTYTRGKRLYQALMAQTIVRRAAWVMASSEATHQELTGGFPALKGKISVVHPGLNPIFRLITDKARLADTRSRLGLPDPFILHVGILEPGKNLAALLQAYALLKRETSLPHKVVSVGARGWLSEPVFQAVESLGLQEDVAFLGYVQDADLVDIYNLADLFVFPSLREGFGFPVLEAMACGTPVVAARAGSLPEITGEAAVLVPPNDASALMDTMRQVLMDHALRDHLVEKGLARARQFSWQEAVRKVLAVYRGVLN